MEWYSQFQLVRFLTKFLYSSISQSLGCIPIGGGDNLMLRQTCCLGKQAMTPENRYPCTVFIENDPIYSYHGKWGWAQDIFSFLGLALQK